ncbi:MAG: glycosyltransferase family 87 protein, partial [bacterium]|nr:glycosyltransferase family 87 protein [bacterium]
MTRASFSFPISPRERVLFWVLLCLLTAYAAGTFFYSAFWIKNDPQRGSGDYKRDFATYYAASKALYQGMPIHQLGPWPLIQPNPLDQIPVFAETEHPPLLLYVYPPFLAWLITPLTHLDYTTAERIWNGIQVGFYLVGITLLVRRMRRSGCNPGEQIAALVLGFFWAPALFTLWGGQVSIGVMLLIIVHVELAIDKRDSLAGAALGLVVLLKFSPLVFLGLWVLWRRWRLVGAAMGWIGAGVILSGWRESAHFLFTLFPHMNLGENQPANITWMGLYLAWQAGAPWGWLTPTQVERLGMLYDVLRGMMLLGWAAVFWRCCQGQRLVKWIPWKNPDRSRHEGTTLPSQIDVDLPPIAALIILSMLLLSPVTRLY